MINSKRKGKNGELEAVRFLRAMGYEVHRTAQFNGNTEEGAADIAGMPGIHWEVKRVQRLNIDDALNQAIRDAKTQGKGDIPIVLHRKNHAAWKVTMDAEDFCNNFLREWESGLWLRETARTDEKKKGTSDLSCGEK